MKEALSTLYGVHSPSMRSRDPDGVNLGVLREVRLDPAGSRSEALSTGPTDSIFSSITADTEMEELPQKSFDVVKLVGAPPPPPKNPPPKKNRKPSRKVEPQKTIVPKSENGSIENDANVANNAPPRKNMELSLPTAPLGGLQIDEHNEDIDDDDLRSFITTESHTIDVDEYSIASRSVFESLGNGVENVSPSPASEVTMPHRNALMIHDAVEKTMTEDAKTSSFHLKEAQKEQKPRKEQKRGFFGKLFRGRKKEKTSHASMDVITEATSQESNTPPEQKSVDEDLQTEETSVEEPLLSAENVLHPDNETASGNELSDEAALALERDISLDGQHNDHLTELPSKASAMKLKKFTQDPPDDDHGDPPPFSGPPLISPTSANQQQLYVSVSEEEEEQCRIESVRSRIAEAYDGHLSDIDPIQSALSNEVSLFGGDISIGSSLHNRPSIDPEADGDFPRLLSTKASDGLESKTDPYDVGLEPASSNISHLRVLVQSESVDPVGASPTLNDDIRGRPEECEVVYQDPVGESPMAWKVWNDPVGESPCHEEDLIKSKEKFDEPVEKLQSESQDPPLEMTVEEEDKEDEPEKQDQTMLSATPETQPSDTKEKSEATRAALDNLKTSQSDVMIVNSTLDGLSRADTLERLSSQQDKRADTALSVTGAAFSNAETIAYIYEMNGEPSPRHTWHSSRQKPSVVLHSPVSKLKKTPKEVLKEKLKEKYAMTQEAARKKIPSPNDYTAENLENMAEREPTPEELLETKDISKFQGFGFKSKFKGRRPTKKRIEVEPTPPAAMLEVLTTIPPPVDRQVMIERSEKERSDTAAIVEARPGRITARAVARGIAMRREKTRGDGGIPKPQGRNRFHFRVPEAEIKDPIQRASRRLLSKAAVRIQIAARIYLAKREAVDRMWAILSIQSYFRRWSCEKNFRAHVHSATALQSVARAWFARAEAKKRNIAATQIQKTIRVYLAGARLYDMMYCLVSIQALVRGSYVRKKQAQHNAELLANSHYAIPLQSLIRGYTARKEFKMINSSACKIQSIWRSYVARIDLQFQIVDIVVVQSVVRRWISCNQVRETKNAPYILPAGKIQARWRGCNARTLHKKMLAARKIQTAWRAFHAYTDYVFALVDILVVQRTVRQWLAVRQVRALQREKAAIAQREQERLHSSSISIQKAWRGFWAFSQYIIVQYEVTRLQAIVRGKLARQNYHLKLGCSIIIQATVRQYLSKKAISSRMVADSLVAAKATELRERNSAKRIQFWWRIVLDWTKEKRAALVIERFFIHVRKEVEHEVNRIQWKASMKRKNRKRRESEGGRLRPVPLPACGGLEDVEEQRMVPFNAENRTSDRSQSAPRPRQQRAPTHRTPSIGVPRRRMPSPSPRRAGTREGHNWPVESVLRLTGSNVTDVSGITTPEVLLLGEKSFERRPREKRSAGDYIKKYNRVDLNSNAIKSGRNPQKRTESPIPEQQSRQHFFSEDRGAPPRLDRGAPSQTNKKLSTQGGPAKRRASSATPRGHRMPPSPHRMPPSPHRGTPPPRRDYRGIPSPQHKRGGYFSPVALTRQHGVIKRDETAETDSMSRSTVSRHSRSSSDGHLDRAHRNPTKVSNNPKKFAPLHPNGERHAVVFLGPDYGEV